MTNREPSASHVTRSAIRLQRLRRRLDEVNRFGAAAGGGIDRLSFSPADMAARRWLLAEMSALGLDTRMDAVGNVIGRWQVGSGAAVMLGSHLDSVPSGGRLDGALGVLAALECVETAMEAGIQPACPIEVVATSEEEGRFGGMLGAQAMAGAVDPRWFDVARDESGLALSEAMRAAGLTPADYPRARRDPDDIRAFLEMHVEQGPVLDRAGLSAGIVEGVSGVFNWMVTLVGEANHAGTTPMDLRRDAFRGLVDFAATLPDIIAEAGTPVSRLTIGKVELSPNYPHTVPGRAEFVVIGRDMEETVMKSLAAACRRNLDAAAAAHDLEVSVTQASWLPPTRCHDDVVAAFERQAKRLGIDAPVMASGAGHDTQVMTTLTRAGMIFVPSRGGISHAPEEHTDWSDIEVGCNLLLHTMLDIAGVG